MGRSTELRPGGGREEGGSWRGEDVLEQDRMEGGRQFQAGSWN